MYVCFIFVFLVLCCCCWRGRPSIPCQHIKSAHAPAVYFILRSILVVFSVSAAPAPLPKAVYQNLQLKICSNSHSWKQLLVTHVLQLKTADDTPKINM